MVNLPLAIGHLESEKASAPGNEIRGWRKLQPRTLYLCATTDFKFQKQGNITHQNP
jgi:hypothetical protein